MLHNWQEAFNCSRIHQIMRRMYRSIKDLKTKFRISINNFFRKDEVRRGTDVLAIEDAEVVKESSNIVILCPTKYLCSTPFCAKKFTENALPLVSHDYHSAVANGTLYIATLVLHFFDEGALLYWWDILKSQNIDTEGSTLLCKFIAHYSIKTTGRTQQYISPYQRVLSGNTLAASSVFYVVVHLVCTQTFTRMNSVLNWCDKLMELMIRRGSLHTENLFCSTLGAAFSAMTRDKMSHNNVYMQSKTHFGTGT